MEHWTHYALLESLALTEIFVGVPSHIIARVKRHSTRFINFYFSHDGQVIFC